MLNKIMDMMPITGKAKGNCASDSIESLIDCEFEKIAFDTTLDLRTQGILEAAYATYTHLTLNEVSWVIIRDIMRTINCHIEY